MSASRGKGSQPATIQLEPPLEELLLPTFAASEATPTESSSAHPVTRGDDTSVSSEWPPPNLGLSALRRSAGWLCELWRDFPCLGTLSKGCADLDSSLQAYAQHAVTLLDALESRCAELQGLLSNLEVMYRRDAQEARKELDGKVLDVMRVWIHEISNLKVGSCTLIPVAWPVLQDRKFVRGRGPSKGCVLVHAAVIVLHRATADLGNLAVVNPLGSGSEYHVQRLNGAPSSPSLCTIPVHLSSLPWVRLCASAFWLQLWRPLLPLNEDPDEWPSHLYEILLPFLGGQQLGAHISAHLDSGNENARAPPDWRTLPRSDATKVNVVVEALATAFKDSEASCNGHVGLHPWTSVLVCWHGLQRALRRPSSRGLHLRPGIVRAACLALARAAAELGCGHPPATKASRAQEAKLLEALLRWVETQLRETARVMASGQTLPIAPNEWNVDTSACKYGGFESLANCIDVSSLAMSPERPDVSLPTPLARVTSTPANFAEAASAVQHCVRAFNLLVNQRHLVQHADFHAFALVQHFFYEVFPVPLRRDCEGDCFWRTAIVDRNTQLVLVVELAQLVRSFLAVSLTLPQTPHLHGVRILTLAAAAAVLDAVLRHVPLEAAAELNRVYSGFLRPDTTCSGFHLASVSIVDETKELCLSDPVAAQLRVNVLDYLASTRAQGRGRSILGFIDMRLEKGDLEFLERLALMRGFMRSGQFDQARYNGYIVGQFPEFLAAFPGLGVLRDCSFLLRFFCAPLADITIDRTRSEGGCWRASDAELRWEVCEDGRLRVYGFQRNLVLGQPVDGAPPVEEPMLPLQRNSSFFSSFNKFTANLLSVPVKARKHQSVAHPSVLVGQPIRGEDDVLHLQDLPSFGGKLLAVESEQLLVILTAPYLRVPLILQFFNNRSRFGSLANVQLQAVMDAVLFEPSTFLEEGAPSGLLPVNCAPFMPIDPKAAEAVLATPAGRLVHELIYSPGAVLPELDGIFCLAMERDSPTYTPAAAPILYSIRLWARTAAFVQAVLRCSSDSSSRGLDAATRGFSGARGKRKVQEYLRTFASSWAARLRLEAVPTLERWCSRAMQSGNIDDAATLWLHLALIFRWSLDLSAHGVSTLLCAELYLNANVKFGLSGGVADRARRQRLESMGMQDTQVFELFRASRPRVYAWLKRECGGDCDRVLEHVVAVVASSQISQHIEDPCVLGRRWIELEETWDGSGRFAPSVPPPPNAALAEYDFAQWITASVDPAPLEVNLNVGQLQFRQHTVTPVPGQVLALPEFREVFPAIDLDVVGLMWAMVERAPNRARYRFAGLRYEFRLWSPRSEEQRTLGQRPFPAAALEGEAWVAEAINRELALQSLWEGSTRLEWLASGEPQTGCVARLYASVPSGDSPGGASSIGGLRWRELEVFRRTCAPTQTGRSEVETVVHLYEGLECGPRFARVQVFTSSQAWSYASSPASFARPVLQPTLATTTPTSRIVSFTTERSLLLEIVHEDFSGESVLVPRRFLVGALPDCLLDVFQFWLARPGRLVGKMQSSQRRTVPVPMALVVHLIGGELEAGQVSVQRVALAATDRIEEAKQLDHLMHAEVLRPEFGERSQTLVDLLRAPEGSGAWEVARWTLQLDDLAHVLVWVREAPFVESVELPRLGLSFSIDSSPRGRLQCDQHGGLQVVVGGDRAKDARLRKLLQPFPRFVLLEDDVGELFVLVSAADKPFVEESGGVVQLQRRDAEWLSALRVDHRHHLFAVHASYEFIYAPTLVAELHLMLIRILHGMYREACAGVLACTASGLASEPEEQLFWQEITQVLANDPSTDAVVLRLKLMLALNRQGRGPPEGWVPERDLIAWSVSANDSCVGSLLTPAEEAALDIGVGFNSFAKTPQLLVRAQVHAQVLQLRALRGHCTLGACAEAEAEVVVPRVRELPPTKSKGKKLNEIVETGLWDANPNDTDEIAYYSHRIGLPGATLRDELLAPTSARGELAVSIVLKRPRLPRDFHLLYEFATGALDVSPLDNDDLISTAALLCRLIPSGDLEAYPLQATLLRFFESNPSLARSGKFPRLEGAIANFIHLLLLSICELREAVKEELEKPDKLPQIAERSIVWTFRRSSEGAWKEEVQPRDDPTGVVKPTTQVSQKRFFSLSDPVGPDLSTAMASGDPRDDLQALLAADSCGGPLTNPRQLALLSALRHVQDRRLPSPTWDFDCNSWRVGDLPEFDEEVTRERSESMQGDTSDCEQLHPEEDDDVFDSALEETDALEEDGNDDLDDGNTTLMLVRKQLQARMSGLAVGELAALVTCPLNALKKSGVSLSEYVKSHHESRSSVYSCRQVLAGLEPGRCPISDTISGRALFERLKKDFEHLSQPASALQFLNITSETVEEICSSSQNVDEKLEKIDALSEAISTMLERDQKAILKAVHIAVELANSFSGDASTKARMGSRRLRAAHRLGQLGGKVQLLHFQDIMQCLLVQGGVGRILPHLNPKLTARSAGDSAAACAVAMLLSTRTIICRRSLKQLGCLRELLQQASRTAAGPTRPSRLSKALRLIRHSFGGNTREPEKAKMTYGQRDNSEIDTGGMKPELWVGIVEAAEQVAKELTTHQPCITNALDPLAFDPRLLCFQFVSRIVLRAKQVELVTSMRAALGRGQPAVHQMLMGEGKTTVITPLLTLVSATAERCCIVCTPLALLEFTRRVLRDRLIGALARPVVLFDFARASPVTDELCTILLNVRDARAVMCTGPTPLKSLLLRYLLTIYEIDVIRTQEHARQERKKESDQKGGLLSTMVRSMFGEGSKGDTGMQRLRELKCEAQVLALVTKFFRDSALLLDDIDLLMHPLRSELHWPLGVQHTLDFTGTIDVEDTRVRGISTEVTAVEISYVAGSSLGGRWQIPFHLLDAIFSCQLQAGPSVAAFGCTSDGAEILRRLRDTVAKGLQEKCLQAAPHLALLSTDFYHQQLRPHLADWFILWLRRRSPLRVKDGPVRDFLCGPLKPKHAAKTFRDLADHQLKALNLGRLWLAVLLPHIISRILHVHYGLLNEKAPSFSGEPRARKHFAVPFVGKDAPSETSQFSHPDVVIGLTWLAYRMNGLREGDFRQALGQLLKMQRGTEADLLPRLRKAQRLYCVWVSAAGGHVRGSMDSGANRRTASDVAPFQGSVALVTHADQKHLALQDLNIEASESTLIVPSLEWLDIRDELHVVSVSRVLRTSPFLMEFYLHEVIFPSLLKHADAMLSASGQDLGSEMLCSARLGFSGTPNDLMPRALGACSYALGDDGRMLHTLTDAAVVEVWPVGDGWNAQSLLQAVAMERPAINALIDVGALITGLSNEDVARTLLDFGIPFEAVVFCEEGGEQRLLSRGRPEPVKLAHCTLPLEKRFVFYDQVHTTGIDIKHPADARAVLTLGKDSTFRDFAQGAYRMRGIGRGQRLRVMLTPEVNALVRLEVPDVPTVEDVCNRGRVPSVDNDGTGFVTPRVEVDGEVTGFQKPSLQEFNSDAATNPMGTGWQPDPDPALARSSASLLDRVCSWLLIRQATTEHTQGHLLRRQALAHEGRRCAYEHLVTRALHITDETLTTPKGTLKGSDVSQALDLFRERVDYTVDTSLTGLSGGGASSLKTIVERMKPFLDTNGSRVVKELFNPSFRGRRPSPTASPLSVCKSDPVDGLSVTEEEDCNGQDRVVNLANEEAYLFAEEEQEHEQELCAEQEQEKEQEEEMEQEEDHEEMTAEEASPAALPWQSVRRDDPPVPWLLEILSKPLPSPSNGAATSFPFYEASKFSLPSLSGRRETCVAFPKQLLMSRNFDQPGRGKVARRLRAPLVLLEWLPLMEREDSARAGESPCLAASTSLSHLRLLLAVLGLVGAERMTIDDSRRLLAALGVEASPEEEIVVTMRVEEARMEATKSEGKGLVHSGSNSGVGVLTPEVIASGLLRAHAVEFEPRRCYVLLTLAEAEAVRIALHRSEAAGESLFPENKCSIALKVLTRDPMHLRVLDASKGYYEVPFRWQGAAISQLLLFLGAEQQYSSAELESLWGLLRTQSWHGGSPTPPDTLRDFFVASHSLRRRSQGKLWQDAPVVYLFRTDAEHEQAQRDRTLREAYTRMLDFGAKPSAVFTALDSDDDGVVRPADFSMSNTSGFPPSLVPRLFRALDPSGSGSITASAWVAAFEGCGVDTVVSAFVAESNAPFRPPHNVPLDILRKITIELVGHTSYTLVWNSDGTSSRKHASLWAPEQSVSGFKRKSMIKLCVGHYLNQGFIDIKGGGRNGVAYRQILQVRDKRFLSPSSGDCLAAVADHYCPCPVKFAQVWSTRGVKQLYVWRPVPPSEAFVALGMVATTTPDPPSVDQVRCVARSFCRPAVDAPVQVWDDSGMGGKPVSFWTVNRTQVLFAASGHTAPQETFWDLAADSVSFDYTGRPSVHVVHERSDRPGFADSMDSPTKSDDSDKSPKPREIGRLRRVSMP